MAVLTREEVARRLGVSYTTIIRWERAGRLTPIKYGPCCVRYAADEVEALALSRTS